VIAHSRSVVLGLVALALAGCALQPAPDPFPAEARTGLATRRAGILASYMEGRFESIAQEGERVDSRPVVLHVVRLWPEREAEFWFYEEYAAAETPDKPYLQRVRRMGEASGDILAAEFYFLPRPAGSLVGEWRKEKPFEGIDPAKLERRVGCRVEIFLSNMVLFNGATQNGACPGELPGVARERLEFFQSSSSLRIWDQGWDSSGRLVFGGAKGPLEFRRLSRVVREAHQKDK
jgi:hypothetical protein